MRPVNASGISSYPILSRNSRRFGKTKSRSRAATDNPSDVTASKATLTPFGSVVFERPTTDPQTVEGCDGQPVTITPPKNTEEVHDLIKRVIAVGGETVENRAGKIYVNGAQLNESYLPANSTTPKFEESAFPTQCIKVPRNEVFVLGDNRLNSAASNRFGPIPESLIVGRAFIRVWPLGSIGGI